LSLGCLFEALAFSLQRELQNFFVPVDSGKTVRLVFLVVPPDFSGGFFFVHRSFSEGGLIFIYQPV